MLYKKLQGTKMIQLFDPGVRKAADIPLAEERGRQRMKFRPTTLVDSIISEDQHRSSKALSTVAKALLVEEEDSEKHQSLCQLSLQGEMARSWESSSPELWARAVQDLPPEPMKFALNASLNTLPTNANLHTWGKKPTDICPLCQTTRQTLVHVLNNCPRAMELRRYSSRHNSVLQVIGDFIKSHLAPHFSISIDSPSEVYSFPHHISPTNLRPDIVWWSDHQRELWLFELTVSFESQVADARARKRTKYYDLVEAGKAAGYRTELITVEVGSRGMLGVSDLDDLREAIDATRKDFSTLTLQIIRTAILGSFYIWGSRNSVT